MLNAIKINKSFGARNVLNNIDLSFSPGIYALQGPNGIGKSTLLRILSGTLAPDNGQVTVNGIDLQKHPVRAKEKLSFVPDETTFYPFLCENDLLRFIAKTKKNTISNDVWELVETLALTQHLKTRFDSMSLGTGKKFMLAAGFIAEPFVYIADEPANALDQNTRRVLAKRLRSYGERNVVLFASHDSDFIARTNAGIVDFETINIHH